MQEFLTKITNLVETYESGAWVSTENLRIMLRELTANNYYLTKENIEAGQKHNLEMYNFNGSVGASKIYADKEVPELRMTRKILEASKQVVMSMQQELSIIKNEN